MGETRCFALIKHEKTSKNRPFFYIYSKRGGFTRPAISARPAPASPVKLPERSARLAEGLDTALMAGHKTVRRTFIFVCA
jgi:hypothetical protein